MARFVYSDDMILFLRSGFTRWRVPELTKRFNARFVQDKTEGQIKSCLKNRKITCGRQPGFKKGENISLLTPEQVGFVKRNYRKMTRHDLVDALNNEYNLSIRLSQLVAFVKNHKITSGRTGRYETGNVPFNAGTKGVMKPNSGSFTKGHKPANYQPIGHEREDRDGYVLVKVAERNPWNDNPSGWYRHKHVLEWERHHGPVPDGKMLRFIDGDKRNISIDNLMLVTRGEHMRLTHMQYNEQPAEVKPTVLGIAKLDQAVYENQQCQV